ncbi:MAG: M16 family metallopeptidase, partial [Bauldia sp.]
MRRMVVKFGVVLLALVLGHAAIAQETPALNYQEYTLDNGLHVVLVEDHTAPVVTVDVWYHVGGANDPEGRSGFAHLFEHMMFQGTANLTKDEFARLIADAGGDYNAYTALDQTGYHVTLPSNQLPLGLWLEADRMASLAVTQTNLDNQRAVVIQEFQQNYGGNPYGLALRDLNTLPYTYGPYQRAPIGAIADVNAATVDEIIAFHETYYVPNNATLVVAGDISPDTARTLIDTYFAGIPTGEEPPALPDFVATQRTEAQTVTVQDSLIRIPALLIGYEGPVRQDPDYAALLVLDGILSGGNSSRMVQELIDTGAALNATTSLSPHLGPSLFTVILLPNVGASVTREDLEQRFYEQLDRILAEGVPQEELDKVIANVRIDRLSRLETSFGLAEQVQVANAYYDDPTAVFTEIDRFTAVTSEDIQRVIREYLAPEDRTRIFVDPSEAAPFQEPVPFVGATGIPADDAFAVDYTLAVTEPPEPLPVSEFNLPAVTRNVLPNGLEVLVVQNDELPVISLDIVFRGGAAAAPVDLTGISGATADLLTRGTTTRTAAELNTAIESRGGAVGSYSSTDFMGVGMFALAEDRDHAFELLADMALNPAFPQEEIDVQRQQLISQIEAARGDPRAQAGRAFYPRIYPNHPYGGIITEETAAAVTRDAVVDFYESISQPDNALLIIAGDISVEDAMALAEQYFGGWEADGDAPTVTLPLLDNGIEGLEIVLVNIPGAQQAELSIGNLAVTGTDPDRFALSVINTLLGDGLSSRLSRNLREQRGYAYSIGSSLTFPLDRGVFSVSTRGQPGRVAESITEILAVGGRVLCEPSGGEELAIVRAG